MATITPNPGYLVVQLGSQVAWGDHAEVARFVGGADHTILAKCQTADAAQAECHRQMRIAELEAL